MVERHLAKVETGFRLPLPALDMTQISRKGAVIGLLLVVLLGGWYLQRTPVLNQEQPHWIRIATSTAVVGSSLHAPSRTDPSTFEIFATSSDALANVDYCWARDKDHVYTGLASGLGPQIFEAVDVSTLVPFQTNPSYYCYGKDKNHAYWFYEKDEGILPQADLQTFTTDDSIAPFAKDKAHVYLLDKVVQDADPATFRTFPLSKYAKDATHVYMFGYQLANWAPIVVGADPNTFEPLPALQTDLRFGPEASYYGRDAHHVYYLAEVIPGADVSTFHQLETFEAQDKNHTYIGPEIRETKTP